MIEKAANLAAVQEEAGVANKQEEDKLNLSQISLSVSSASLGQADDLEDDNNIDKAFKKLQKKKDKFIRFQKKRQARIREKRQSEEELKLISTKLSGITLETSPKRRKEESPVAKKLSSNNDLTKLFDSPQKR